MHCNSQHAFRTNLEAEPTVNPCRGSTSRIGSLEFGLRRGIGFSLPPDEPLSVILKIASVQALQLGGFI